MREAEAVTRRSARGTAASSGARGASASAVPVAAVTPAGGAADAGPEELWNTPAVDEAAGSTDEAAAGSTDEPAAGRTDEPAGGAEEATAEAATSPAAGEAADADETGAGAAEGKA